MARTRDLKPAFFLDEDLAEQPPLARLLFQALWCLADRDGRLEDRPARIKVQALPYDACDVDLLLDGLAAGGFVVRYEVDGRHYLQVRTFGKHQSPHPKEASAGFPPPPPLPRAEKPAQETASSGEPGKETASPGFTRQAAKGSFRVAAQDPLPSLSSLPSGFSGSSEREGSFAPARDPTPPRTATSTGTSTTARPPFSPVTAPESDPNRPIESAHDLLWRYRIRWEARHRAQWVGEKADHVIAREILERLAELGPEREAAARSLIPAAMDLYLADSAVAAHRHPLKWFDERLGSLVADAQVGTEPAAREARVMDRPCEFHRKRDTRGRPASKAQFRNECPECRTVSARMAPRPASAPATVGDLIASAGGAK